MDAKISAQILGAFFSRLGWFPRARKTEWITAPRQGQKRPKDGPEMENAKCPRKSISGPFFGHLNERQITHLICARLKYDLCDFFRGVLGLLPVLFLV